MVVEYDHLHIKQALSSYWLEGDSLAGIAMFILHGTAGHTDMPGEYEDNEAQENCI